MQLKVTVSPELESDNQNCLESESDDWSSDSTALNTTPLFFTTSTPATCSFLFRVSVDAMSCDFYQTNFQ